VVASVVALRSGLGGRVRLRGRRGCQVRRPGASARRGAFGRGRAEPPGRRCVGVL